MTREEAVRNVAIATGMFVDEVRRAFDNLCKDKEDAESLMKHIKALGKQMHPRRKSYASPYAKFDKIRKRGNDK